MIATTAASRNGYVGTAAFGRPAKPNSTAPGAPFLARSLREKWGF